MNEDEKKCPFCAEVIKVEAIKCKYCGSSLPHGTSAEALHAIPMMPDKSVGTPSSRKAFWVAGAVIVAALVGIVGWMFSGPSKSDMEAQIRTKLQNYVDTDSDLRAHHIEVLRVDLIKSGSNTYDGMGIAKCRGEEHKIPLQVTTDGSRYMLQTMPMAFAFVAKAELEKAAGEMDAAMKQAEQEWGALISSTEQAASNAMNAAAEAEAAAGESQGIADDSGAEGSAENCEQGASNMAEVFACEYSKTETTIEAAELELRAVLSRGGFREQVIALRRSQEQWRSARNADCQQEYDEAFEESGGYAEADRLACIQNHNEWRVEALRAYSEFCSNGDPDACALEYFL